jgi:feruloyl-CoA synthase
MSADHARIRAIAELVDPGLVFVDDAGPFATALDAVAGYVGQTLTARGDRPGTLRLDDLLTTRPSRGLEEAVATVGADTVAKLLFTSGSTATPKGVVNTHRMLCSNQAALRQVWPFLATEPPVLVDWLPWSHTFGANHNFNLVRSRTSPRPCTSTCRPDSRCSPPRSSATRSSPGTSSAGCGSCSTPGRRCPRRSRSGSASWPRA